MATTPNSAPLTSGTTGTASVYTVTATSTADLAAAQSAIKQATGNAAPAGFTVGSTMSVSKSATATKFVQGSTTTPAANKAVSSSPATKNTGTSQSNVLQSILGIAPLATVGLSVFNKVSSGVSFGTLLTNLSNSVSSVFSVSSSQNPVNPANTAASGYITISPPDQFAPPATPAPPPSTNSTNNVVDPAQRQQTAALTPSTNSTNNVQDPAQRALAQANANLNNNVENTAAPNSLVDEESAFPPNTVAQQSSNIDEESAFPPNTVAQQSSNIDEESAFPPNTVGQNAVSDAEASALVPTEENPFPATESTTVTDTTAITPASVAVVPIPGVPELDFSLDPVLSEQEEKAKAARFAVAANNSLIAATDGVVELTDGFIVAFENAQNTPDIYNSLTAKEQAELPAAIAELRKAKEIALETKQKAIDEINKANAENPDLVPAYTPKTIEEANAELRAVVNETPSTKKALEEFEANQQKQTEELVAPRKLLTDEEIAEIYPFTDPKENDAKMLPVSISDDARALLSDPAEIARQQALNKLAAENPVPQVTVVTTELTDAEAEALLFDPPPVDDGGAGDDELIENLEPDVLTDEQINQELDNVIAQQQFEDSFVDDATGVDDAVAQQQFEDSFVDDATGVDDAIAQQQFEDSFVDDATGVDEAVERQRQLEDGSLEFAGIDEQIDANTYIDSPQTVSDEEIDAEIARAQAENIENQDPREISDEEAESLIRASTAEEIESEDPNEGGPDSNKTALRNTQAAQAEQIAQNFDGKEDWRVRLSLSPDADYLYKVGQGEAGILNPLQATEGVIFPYTPAISVVYSATYDSTDITHSNYKFFSYKNSNVDTITITADFTAQDTAEAQYLLAVIHFFRSVTKMFYGQDPGPGPGVPPPLCYLRGLGAFQFNWHPLVINNFTYSLPTDVDYIRVMDTSSRPGVNVGSGKPKGKPGENVMAQRMAGANLQPGGLSAPPKFNNSGDAKLDQNAVTYVPTKMQITVTANPIVSRNNVSNNFSLKDYATGHLLAGGGGNGAFW